MNTLLLFVIKWLAGITAAQWEFALKQVIQYATVKITSAEKRTWVIDSLRSIGVTGWVANLLVELTHGFAKKKKLIS